MKITKILRNLCLYFARQDGQDGKNQKENHATKVTKIPKTKRRKYGMNETFMHKLPHKCSNRHLIFLLYFWPVLKYSTNHN